MATCVDPEYGRATVISSEAASSLIPGEQRMVVCSAGRQRCGIRLADVREVLRPLPLAPIPGAPGFVLGAALVRGEVTPVVDVGLLLGEVAAARRWVSLLIGSRAVVLAFSGVLGVRVLPPSNALPPLLRDASPGVVEALGVLDSELLFVLSGARLIHDAVSQVPA